MHVFYKQIAIIRYNSLQFLNLNVSCIFKGFPDPFHHHLRGDYSSLRAVNGRYNLVICRAIEILWNLHGYESPGILKVMTRGRIHDLVY